MTDNDHPAPRPYPGVMISSTFTDLEQHRLALIKAIKGEGLADVAMENDSARPNVDVIDSSLQKVQDASAFIGVISRKYGQTPPCPTRNPDLLSITELEFNEARRLDRPILLFIMEKNHLLREDDVESDAAKKEKLNAFRERAKQMKPDSPVHRVYATFDNLEDFEKKAIHAVAELRRYLDKKSTPSSELPPSKDPDTDAPITTSFLGDYSHLNYDRRPVLSHTVDELDAQVIKDFLAKPLSAEQLAQSGLHIEQSSSGIVDKLQALGCCCDGHPTLGALLCFAPPGLLVDKFGACSIQMVRYDGPRKGTSRPSITSFPGNLLSLHVEGMSWLTRGAGLKRRGGVGRADRDELEVPKEVLREALANAIVHRDYEAEQFRDQPTRVEVFSDRIEITSYGNLMRKVPVKSLNSPTDIIVPWRRNHVIAKIFQHMTLVELNASGVSRMRIEMERASLAFPKFINDLERGVVRVILLRPLIGVDDFEVGVPTPSPSPGQYFACISSAANDLPDHQRLAFDACRRLGLFPLTWDSVADNSDPIRASLHAVDAADIFVGIYGWRYGQIPAGQDISVSEMEFNRAIERGIPILIFEMHEDHPVTRAMVETGEEAQRKLAQFKSRLKESYLRGIFVSPEDLRSQMIPALADAVEKIKALCPPSPIPTSRSFPNSDYEIQVTSLPDPIPTSPALYAEPPYYGSHRFIGRQAQLDVLSDWALPADPHPVLLFDAIGGSGKSILTWEWTTKQATQIRGDWAGRFWYSFYERGAIMADFCRRALAYVTGMPLENFRRMKTLELGEQLLHHLQARPWLLVLDGLERVLVAYHRFDAAQVPDEEANKPTDQIAHRDPCAAVRPEDDDLLRALAAAAPSKLLITSRLVPRVLLNQASQPIPGVLRVALPGLRPADAEALLRSCGVTGDSQAIQDYLKTHCDCHPLVTGVLAGLINEYLPDKGNFDAWSTDPAGGGQLNLADLDLVQKRNHILKAALDAIPEKSRQLLSTLALLSDAVDYPTLSAFDPHQPPDPKKLANTVHDLERRGLLLYDALTKRYDLHPVVRAVAAGGLKSEETVRYGQRVVDHFFREAHRPYEQAETLEDLRDGLRVVRTLLKMGRYQEACNAYRGDLANALLFNLEAYEEILSLVRPFFPQGWTALPNAVDESGRSYLADSAAIALSFTVEREEALMAWGAALLLHLGSAAWTSVRITLSNISVALVAQNRLAKQERCLLLALDLAALTDNKELLFRARMECFEELAGIGQLANAQEMWQLLDPMGRGWSRAVYRPGDAEWHYARFQFWKGELRGEHLAHAEQLAKAGKNRLIVRKLHGLRGQWRLEQGQWALAAESLHEAVRMARAVGTTDATAETQLALAKFQLGQLADPRREAEQLANARQVSHRDLADLWLALGDPEQAKKYALEAYKWACADGEPYVHRYELNKAAALLQQLGVEIPKLPPYDPAKDEKLPWEDEVAAAIEKLRAKKKAEKRKKY